MFIIDTHGRKIETSALPEGVSLIEKLLSALAVINGSPLDQTGTIFIYLDNDEEQSFMEFYKKNFWVKTFQEEVFAPITQDFEDALDSIVSGINKNRTNGWGRFVPCKGTEMKSDPLHVKPLYGWIYIPIPKDIALSDGNRISINFSR